MTITRKIRNHLFIKMLLRHLKLLLIIEKNIVDDDDNKSMWYGELDKVKDTWEMAILIDKLKKL